MMKRRRQPDTVDKLLALCGGLRKESDPHVRQTNAGAVEQPIKYRLRDTIAGIVKQPIRQAVTKKPPRDKKRKNMQRRLREPPHAKTPKPAAVPRLIEHTERDSAGAETTRYFGDPMAWMGQFTNTPPTLVEPHGAARDAIILQMHAAGMPDKKIAELAHVAVKTVERALKKKRKRPRTRKE